MYNCRRSTGGKTTTSSARPHYTLLLLLLVCTHRLRGPFTILFVVTILPSCKTRNMYILYCTLARTASNRFYGFQHQNIVIRPPPPLIGPSPDNVPRPVHRNIASNIVRVEILIIIFRVGIFCIRCVYTIIGVCDWVGTIFCHTAF